MAKSEDVPGLLTRPIKVVMRAGSELPTYANYVQASASPHEVVVDFGFIDVIGIGKDQEVPATITQRVALPPAVVDTLIEALRAMREAQRKQSAALPTPQGKDPKEG